MKEVLSWERVEGGGWQMIVQGYKYPLCGLPKKEIVNASALVKRMIMASIRLAVRFPLLLLPLGLVSKKKLMAGILEWLSDLYRGDYGLLLNIPEEDYSKPIRELIRTLKKINPVTHDEWILLLACIFEIDLAYRRRMQDILEELNKGKLLENPRREVFRLMDVAIGREQEIVASRWQADKMRLLRKVLHVIWLFKPFRDIIIAFLTEVRVYEIKRSHADWYWTFDLFDYDYGGTTYEYRQALKKKEHEGWIPPKSVTPTPIDGEVPKIDINAPNQAFYKLTEEGAVEMGEQTKQALITNWRQKQNV